jgi:hypothetical protein
MYNRKLEQGLLSSDGQPWAGSRLPNPKLGSVGKQTMTRTSGSVFGPTGRLDGRGLHAQDSQTPKPNARPDGLLPLVLGQGGLGSSGKQRDWEPGKPKEAFRRLAVLRRCAQQRGEQSTTGEGLRERVGGQICPGGEKQ